MQRRFSLDASERLLARTTAGRGRGEGLHAKRVGTVIEDLRAGLQQKMCADPAPLHLPLVGDPLGTALTVALTRAEEMRSPDR
ncbi:hypothetical protein C8D77_11661 [Mesorhizobium loti]|uniref:Uncharacterized protein n=1 Tax=Rhizobium loti TaxID=381 RepID=A0A8E2W929_RHILI|nr:hypothetical protein C8D77_11661 [Mesorhizobium loti]CCV11707.1 conserved hypothetical protein [Mesorhizobium sp. STM 4661]